MSSLTDLEPHLDVPCANTSETPSVPTQIVRQVRLAGRELSTWLMCVVPWKLLPMLVWPQTIHQLAPMTWRRQLSWPHRRRPGHVACGGLTVCETFPMKLHSRGAAESSDRRGMT